MTVTGGGSGGGGHGWTPVGTDRAVYGEFDVARPGVSLADACDDAGIAWVELVVLDATGTTIVADEADGLWADCYVGYIDSLAALLTPGTYQYYWVAYDGFDSVVQESEVGYLTDIYAGYYDAPSYAFGDVYLEVTLNYEDYDTESVYSTCAGSGASTVDFEWVLYDGDPDAGGLPIYNDGGDNLCPDYLVIDDAFDDLLYGGYTYYLELFSTNGVGGWWETLCAIDVYYGENYVECDVPVYFP